MNKIVVDKDAMNNILESPEQRKLAYKIYAIIGLLFGAAQVFLSISGYNFTWFEALIGTYLFLAIPFGGLALTNTPTSNQQKEVAEEVLPDITE